VLTLVAVPLTSDTVLADLDLPSVTGSAPRSSVAVALGFIDGDPPVRSAAGSLPYMSEMEEEVAQTEVAAQDMGERVASLASPPSGPAQAPAAWISFSERLPSGEPPAAPPVRLAEPTVVDLYGKPPPPRKSLADLTAAACFAHAPDYSCISGQVDYCPTRNEWQLRYASEDETDRYGGLMVLMDNGRLRSLSDGQNVRVEGRLIDDRDPPGSPGHYEVRRLTPLSSRNAGVPR
jgi:hypothetical protein